MMVTAFIMRVEYMLDESLVREAAAKLNLSPKVVEKDYHVTKVLHLLSNIKNEHYDLIFQGGTWFI